jgi:hypothetical protein
MHGVWPVHGLDVASAFAVELLRTVEQDAEKLADVLGCFELGPLAFGA